jgi:hypothetical protein
MVDIGDYFDQLTIFTKSYVVLSLVLGGLFFLKLIPVTWVYIYVPNELWNPKFILSFIFLGKLNLSLLFELYFFTLVCTRLEQSYRPKRYADFLVMLLFIAVLTILCETILNWQSYVVLSKAFVMAIIYIFCKRNPNERMFLMFAFHIKASYFPFAQLFLEILQGGSIWSGLIGIGIGHLFVYFKDVLPAAGRGDWLKTPEWAKRFVLMIQTSRLPFVGEGGVNDFMGRNQDGNRVFAGRGRAIG